MPDPFVHLRVASGYSLQYGASHPGELVATAAAHGMDTLAITDRDGLYGAVRFAKACLRTGVAPVVGVDLAVPFGAEARRGRATPVRRTAARGGIIRDLRLPRVVAIATSRAGWGQLCRLTTATHLAGQRGHPVSSPERFAEHASSGELLVMLGADSQFGLHLAEGRSDLAERELRRWLDLVDPHQLVVGLTNHQVAGQGVGSAHQAAGMLTLADRHRLTAVLTNQVRMAHRHQAAVTDVLDAARRLVPLDVRNVDRRNAEAHLKSGKQMLQVAEEVARLGGRGSDGAQRLFSDTRTTALRARLDPRSDIGLGEVHLPEFEVLGLGQASQAEAMAALRLRCEAGISERYGAPTQQVLRRLDEELDAIAQLGYASYFLTVADVVEMVRQLGIRCAARGSGAGSLVNYVLGISGVDPLAYGLVMERFLSPLRQALPDIDLDVESARRPEIYQKVLDHFGGERVACVAMLETYRVRHAVRDVSAALSLPPAEADAIAKAFPHIRARDARKALRDLPELRKAGLAEQRLDVLFRLVEQLDGLPRHVALHPCGVILSDATLTSRTPVEASFEGFPMSQFDKDDVEDLGLLKLDVLGIRMQSSMAHALGELERTTASVPDIDALAPFDDPAVYDMIAHAQTLGCFQIESPGQRELVGKFGPSTFNDIIIDISLFRPGPVKSDMVIPFLDARQGWSSPNHLHPDLEPVLAETGGVVVFHEQIIKIISVMTGCSLAQGDEARRALGDPAGQLDVRQWFVPLARERGYPAQVVEKVWRVLESFASFGFCKAHAAAFALPTYQSAWLKRHHPAHFLAGVLTHDPGMYPKRLILEEARRCGIQLLGVDINHSDDAYRVEALAPSSSVPEPVEGLLSSVPEPVEGLLSSVPEPVEGLPDGRGWGIRMSLSDVKGAGGPEVARIVAGQPYGGLSDFWSRAQVSAPLVENLVLCGAFDELYGVGRPSAVLRHGRLTRRDLLLALADLKRQARADARAASRARGLRRSAPVVASGDDPRDRARRQARTPTLPGTGSAQPAGVQLALDFTEPVEEPLSSAGTPTDVVATGLPEMGHDERLAAELEILGLDVSQHVVEGYRDLLDELHTCDSVDLLRHRQQADLLVAGVKVATQTPPVRSGRRVVFLTLDDGTGPVDCTFFEDAQGPYANTVFSSWLLLVRGQLRRTGPRGVSLRATGAWDLAELHQVWASERDRGAGRAAALAAVLEIIERVPEGDGLVGERLGSGESAPQGRFGPEHETRAGGMGRRRMLVHPSGFKQSPYADVKPAGTPVAQAPRKLWHSSPGSSGR
ncbi:DNA polymerase III subunit alpha [Luteococcus sp. OSA5]|uniref:DNA polymerase III subunit alpha n=1 Tax=Luteococcus sp. OSA5 TaxID=3401630 RepID=UPI003B42FF0D